MDKINDFKEVFDWICYDYEQKYGFNRDSDGNFYFNKLYISKDLLAYKTENYSLAPGLYEKVDCLYSLLNDPTLRYIMED